MQSGYRLDQLPADILIRIRLLLNPVYDPNAQCFTPLYRCQLQLVSRFFRQLELDIPQLWTHVDVQSMTRDRIALQLARSKVLGMSLHLSINEDQIREGLQPVCICDRLSMIKQSSNRWEVSSMDIKYKSYDEKTHVCLRTLDGTTFPSLTNIRSNTRRESALSTIRSWSLPSLKKLQILKGNHTLPFLDAAVSLDTLDMLFWHCRISAETIFQTLSHASLSHLRRLDIEWESCKVTHFIDHSQATIMPSVTELRLIISSGKDEILFITRIMQMVKMPNLAVLYLGCSEPMSKSNELISWLSSLRNPALVKASVIAIESRVKSSREEETPWWIRKREIHQCIKDALTPEDGTNGPSLFTQLSR